MINRDIEKLIYFLPRGALLTHHTTQNREDELEPSVPEVEVRAFNSRFAPILNVTINAEQLSELIEKKVVEFDSTSGRDPELYYYYDYYIKVTD